MDILQSFLQQYDEIPPEPEIEEPEYLRGQQRSIKQCAPPDTFRSGESIDVSRRKIAKAMRDYMMLESPDHMLLIPAPPGTGKTWAGVEFAAWAFEQTGRRVFYAGPRKDFFVDVAQTALEQGQPLNNWYQWKARQNNDQDATKHTCHHDEAINLWMHKGFNGMDFCSQVCGWDYVNNGCRYHKQKDRSEPLIYGQHAHVVLGHPLTTQFGVVIGDENPMGAFVNEWRVPTKHLAWSQLPVEDPLTRVLYDLQKLCENGSRLHGPDLIKMLGVDQVINACEKFSMPANVAVIAPHLHTDEDVDKAPYNYLPVFVPMLLMEAMAVKAGVDYLQRIWATEQGLTLLTRHHVNEQMPKHMIWFDATGRKGLYEALFERDVEVVDVRPQLTGKIYQVVDRANGKGSLVDKNERQTHRVEQVVAQVDAICKDYKRPAVITYQAIKDKFSQSAMHFYGNRGSNHFQDCDVLVVVGTPQPPLFQIEKTAKAIWNKRMRPFDTKWYTRERVYNHIDADGNGWCYPVSAYADEELNEILWQYREAEIIQAAHRARILFRDVPVYLLTNVPIDELPPTELLTIRDLMNAPEGVDVFKWTEVVLFAENCESEQGFVSVGDLVSGLDISKPTALKYIDSLISSGTWELAIVKSTGGRPPKAIRRGL